MARSIPVAGSATLTTLTSVLAAALFVGNFGPGSDRWLPPRGLRPAIDTIPLQATSDGQGASGLAVLRRAPSPFSMPLSPDGHLRYEVRVTAQGLPPDPRVFGGATHYVAWATVPNLSLAIALGPLDASSAATGEVDWNKFIVLITAERAAPAQGAASGGATSAHWSGPILLRGSSPSTWMQRFQSSVLNNGGNPQW